MDGRDDVEVRIPAACRCWMLRGDDLPTPPICTGFEPNPSAVLRDGGGGGHPLCLDCSHARECHRAPEEGDANG